MLLFSRYWYTKIRSGPWTQQPSNSTRFGCLTSDIVSISVRNSRSPCFEWTERVFTAIDVPSFRVPYVRVVGLAERKQLSEDKKLTSYWPHYEIDAHQLYTWKWRWKHKTDYLSEIHKLTMVMVQIIKKEKEKGNGNTEQFRDESHSSPEASW